MKQIYHNLKLVLLSFAFFIPALSFAVTQKEMEEARTIAAKAYIRWANDGSGYLDESNPKTMEELEAILKPKEQENLKAFKAIKVPTDYQSWDKAKLVEFWVAAFQDPSLLEKGRGGRIRARSLINKMTIAAPQSVTQETTAPVPDAKEANSANEANITKEQSPEGALQVDEQAILDDEAFNDEFDIESESSYTWVYIMILAILVAIVIALVVYAANVFKKKGEGAKYIPQNPGFDKDHYESKIYDQEAEISMLTKKLETANKQNNDLKAKLEGALAELAALKATSSERMMREDKLENKVPNSKGKEEFSEKRSAEHAEQSVAPRGKSPLRSIYLGRANTRGMFVRADRSLNPGHSVFLLDTTDGRTGYFKVADSPAVWRLVFSNPAEYLATACTGQDLEDTEYATQVITDSPGTAVFEDGCWRVVRKARIRYE